MCVKFERGSLVDVVAATLGRIEDTADAIAQKTHILMMFPSSLGPSSGEVHAHVAGG